MFKKEDTHKKTPWRAKWIWLDEKRFPNQQESESYSCMSGAPEASCIAVFEKRFALQKPCETKAYISADCRYRLSINGKIISDGPMESGGDCCRNKPMGHRYYDCCSVEYAAGENVIEVLVSLQPELAWSDISEGRGGLIFESETPELVLCSDESWLGGVYAKMPNSACFDPAAECALYPAEETEDIWGALLPRELPELSYKEIAPTALVNPLCTGRVVQNGDAFVVSAGAPVTFWVDFGKIYSCYIELEIACAGKPILRMAMQEFAGNTNRATYYARLAQGEYAFRTLKMYGAQYVQFSLENLTAPVKITPKLIYKSYPVTREGYFKCSDESLNKIYDLGKWTLEICRQSYHMDSPVHQEPLGDTGDYLVESLVGYACFGDSHLTRMDILRTAKLLIKEDGKMFHTAYSLMWPQLILDYILHTGDAEIIEEADILPALDLLMKRFAGYVGEKGIIEHAPNYMFVDWVEIDGFNLHHPPRVLGQGYMTANYYNALVCAEKIYTRLGLGKEAKACAGQAAQVKVAFACLYDDERGLYFDGFSSDVSDNWLPAGQGKYFTYYTNTAAVLYDVCPREKAEGIMEALLADDSLVQPQPFFMHFVFEALEKTDLFEKYGNTLMCKWKKLLDECSGGLKEVWGGFDCDYCHAWSATPTYQMISKVLGITPVDDGYTKVKIAPQLGDLSWAEGSVPTPLGMLYVRHEKKNGQIVTTYTLPDGMETESGDGK